MFFKLALLVALQAFYATADEETCGIDACAFQACAQLEATAEEKEKCCGDAVKDLCTLNHLYFGFDPAQGPSNIRHEIGTDPENAINVDLSNVFVKGIRAPDSYSNHTCHLNGFELNIHYKTLDIFASTNEGSFHAVAEDVKGHVKLEVVYSTDGVAVVSITAESLPEISAYTVTAASHQTELTAADVDPAKVQAFVADLLIQVYTTIYTQLFNKVICQ